MRTFYAHPVDVIRKYNPQISLQNLQDDDVIQNNDIETITSHIEEAESEFESLTRNPFRLVRRGTPGRPTSYEAHEADLYRTNAGVKFWLDKSDVEPLDSTKNDELQLRTGRDAWTTITDEEGSRWDADFTKGWIRIYARYRRSFYRPGLRDKMMRITYRHGAPGDSRNKAAQTELTSPVAMGDTTFDVESAGRLIRPPFIAFIGGDEYVEVTDRDLANDTITVSREARNTRETSHDSGATVHYCPLDVRSAVAAKVAVDFVSHEGWISELAEGRGLDSRERVDKWEQTWEQALNKYSSVRSI